MWKFIKTNETDTPSTGRRRTIISVFSSNVAAAAIGISSNIALARLLPTDTYGTAIYCFSIILMASGLIDFGLSNSIVIEYSRENNKNIISNSNTLFTLIAIVCCAIASGYAYFPSSVELFPALSITQLTLGGIILAALKYITAIHQAKNDWPTYNNNNIIASAVRAIFIIFTAIYITQDHKADAITLLVDAYIVSATLTIAIVLRQAREHITITWEKDILRSIARTSSKLALANSIIVIAMRIDLFIVEKLLGKVALGAYAAANSLALAFPLLTGALMAVYMKSAAQSMGNAELASTLNSQKKLITPAIIATTLLISAAGPIIELVFGARYVDAIPPLQILLVAYVGGTIFTPLEGHLYARQPGKVWKLKLIQLAILATASASLAELYNIIGVACAVVISRIAGWIYIYYWARTTIKSRDPKDLA